MKNLILTTAILLSAMGWSQEKINNQRSVSVYGSTTYEPEIVEYKSDVSLTIDSGYYNDSQMKTAEDLKKRYFDLLKERGVDTSQFKEDKLAYVATGYGSEGTMLRFVTKDKEDLIKALSLRLPQIVSNYVQVRENMATEKLDRLTQGALKDARQNAEVLAKNAGSKLGKIISISATGMAGLTEWHAMGYQTQEFALQVTYELVD